MTAPGRRGADPPSQSVVRGAILVAVAVILGAVLLGKAFDSGGGATSANGGNGNGNGEETTTTAAEGTTTTAAPLPHPVNEVKVWVLNGGGPQGVAGTATDALNALGYPTIPAENAGADVPTSVVYYLPEYEADAPAVASAVGLQPTAVQPMPDPPPFDIQDAKIVVIMGPDAPNLG